jgi:predicted acylesterase/phospholipase RssA
MVENTPSKIPEEDRIFEIGLVMAGAISAGAYTAGVADFLIEALDAWYEWNRPRGYSPHEVKIRVISGASAGGMTGSILTAAFGWDLPPVREKPKETSPNKLYRSWVQDVDIKFLLETNDIDAALDARKLEKLRARGRINDEEFKKKIVELYLQEQKLKDSSEPGKLAKEETEKRFAQLYPNALISLLDSTRLRHIALNAVAPPQDSAGEGRPRLPLMERRPYLPDRFELYLSLANLRGVPYLLKMQGGGSRMVMHADFAHFALADEPGEAIIDNQYMIWKNPRDPDEVEGYAFWLGPDYKSPAWQTLATAALATGAFPFGLAPVKMNMKWDAYKHRTFPVSVYRNGVYTHEFRPLPPEQSEELSKTGAYDFISVDGGLLDNAPFDLAHRALTEKLGTRNERNPQAADRTIILIAPFPDSAGPDAYSEPKGLEDLASAILGSLMKQVRFNPDQLILALNPKVASRFLISPAGSENPYSPTRRQDPDLPTGAQKPRTGDIACGTLGGFGGFLSEEFRHHDFMLGRRNCQQFLRRHFVLPASNKLFDNWDRELRDRFNVPPPPDAEPGEDHYLPVIPLVGKATEEVECLPWPSYSAGQLEDLTKQIEHRYRRLARYLIDTYLTGWMWKALARTGIYLQRRKVPRSLAKTVWDNLKAYGIGLAEPHKRKRR